MNPQGGRLAVAEGTRTRGSWLPWLLLAYALLVSSYFVVRPGSHWSENDTGQQALAIRSVGQSAMLVPDSGYVYSQGYGYPVLSNVLMAVTGLGVQQLQQVAYPLVTALLVFPAWALFRELTGSGRAAALAVLLLFLQPEFLFVVLRGSHERLVRLLMLVSFWLLVRSVQSRAHPARFAVHVVLFYLVAFGLIATNTLFGLSFVLACGTAAAATWLLRRRAFGLAPGVLKRLATVTVSLAILAFAFLFYVYPPGAGGIGALHELGQKATGVVFATETETATNPYLHVVEGWTSLPVYFLLSTSTYLLMAVSAPIWLWQGIRWLRGRAAPSTAAQIHWLLFGVFALQGALAILADRTNVLGANLQHRSFPSFAMIATPLVAAALVRWRARLWIRAGAGASVAALASLAVLKATNEPTLSNKWTFYTPVEARALAWTDAHHRATPVWIGFDERLSAAYGLLVGPTANLTWTSDPRGETRSFLITDVIRLQGTRLNQPLPALAGANRVYDSGAAQLYRLPPATPYQR